MPIAAPGHGHNDGSHQAEDCDVVPCHRVWSGCHGVCGWRKRLFLRYVRVCVLRTRPKLMQGALFCRVACKAWCVVGKVSPAVYCCRVTTCSGTLKPRQCQRLRAYTCLRTAAPPPGDVPLPTTTYNDLVTRGSVPLHVPYLVGTVSFFHNVPGVGKVGEAGCWLLGVSGCIRGHAALTRCPGVRVKREETG